MPSADAQALAEVELLFAALSALRQMAHVAHQRTSGPTFYGDHLMLERIYTGLDTFIDTLGERIVRSWGISSIESPRTIEAMLAMSRRWSTASPAIFGPLQSGAQEARDQVVRAAERVPRSLGWDDTFARLDAHLEETLYLLGQRTR